MLQLWWETISGSNIRADLVVIGASAGDVEAVKQLVRSLPKDFPAAVCIVVHIGNRRSYFPDVLSQVTHLPVAHGSDGERIVEAVGFKDLVSVSSWYGIGIERKWHIFIVLTALNPNG